jgi:hypothetical protein
MLRLIHPTSPYWIDLGYGVEVEVLPLTSTLMLPIRADMNKAIASSESLAAAVSDATADKDGKEAMHLLTRSAARCAIISWRGIGDADGNPIGVSPAGIDALMDVFQICDAFRDAYIVPRLMLESEKNGLSPAPNGTLAGALTTADGATDPAESAPTP